MLTALVAMEDNNLFSADFSRDSFDADSLSGLHTSWLDDEQLNNLPIMDVFTDVSTSKAQQKETDTGGNTIETTETTDLVLSAALGEHDAQFLDGALDFPFDTDLSPILEPFADAPRFEEPQKQSKAMSPLKMQRRRSKSPKTRTPARKTTSTTPRKTSKPGLVQLGGEVPVQLAVTKRPRTRSSSWQEQEKNTFYAMFKLKWPAATEGAPMQPFSSLLLERFDAISTKLRTKSVMEVRQFYTTVMQNISAMLKLVENDIDLSNPDQVRIAVWCWSKLIKKHSEELQALDSDSADLKERLANVLLQSIIRSRRQMLKAKTEHTSHQSLSATGAVSPGLTSISAWVSRSNLSSFFAKGILPVAEDSKVQVHHPTVRKKYPISQPQVPAPAASFAAATDDTKRVLSLSSVQQPHSTASPLKRKRTNALTDDTPSKKIKRTDTAEAATFMSPTPTDKRSRTRNGVAFHTPQQFSKKKVYIKMRMVPRDKQTKANVVSSGCRPKVELKLSSTKKISEVAAHMSKKWAKVRPLLPKGAVLCFFQKNSSAGALHGADGWSKDDSSVTCFDIWKHCGKQTNGENVVEVSYLWKVPTTPTAGEMMPLQAPPGLFEKEVSALNEETSSSDESELAQLSPAHGLQEFGEKVAFDRSLTKSVRETSSLEALVGEFPDDDDLELSPTTGRPRRRIQPMLVSTEEFKI